MFGHPVTLNFDKKGDTHNTWIGGIFSIFVKLFMVFFIALKVKKLVLREGAGTSNATILKKVDLMGDVEWNDLRISTFFVLK